MNTQDVTQKIEGNYISMSGEKISWTALCSDSVFLYQDEDENPGIDRTFGLHALFGILWVVFAFLQIVPIRKASLDLHRSFGYIAIATFFLHMWAAINSLFFDDGRHTMENR